MKSARTFARQAALYLWYKTAVPVWLERGVVGACLTLATLIFFTNPMKFDATQRITLTISLVALSLFAAQTVHRRNEASKKPAPEPATQPQENKPAPVLRGEMEQLLVGSTGDKGKDTGITLVVSIRNPGTPSIAERWDLIVDIPNKGRFTTFMPYFEGELRLPSAHHLGKTVVYREDDLLYRKTVTPITDNVVRGILVFVLKGVPRDVVYQKGTKIELSFADVTGKRYTLPYDIRTGPNNLLSIAPGMYTEIRQEPTPQPRQPPSKRKKPRRK